MTKLKSIDDATFQQEVLESAAPVIVEFWAQWCPPCKLVAPLVEELSGEYGERVRFTKMNTDENYDVPAQLGIQSIPTLVIFQGGRELNRVVGYAPKPQLKRQIDRALGVTA